MKILVNDLKTNPSMDLVCDFQNEIKNIDDIININPASIHVDAFFNEDELILSITGQISMVLACAKTLKPIPYQIDLNASIVFGQDEDADYVLTDKIDLHALIFGEMIAEKPIAVYHPDASDVSFEKEKSPHPAFADLDKLFKKS